VNDRINVQEAARRLGISEGAVRQRISRGTLEYEKSDDGRIYVLLDSTHGEQTGVYTDSASEQEAAKVVEILEAQNEFLRHQLEQEREANRENRRLLAAALERIPELEAPSEPQRSSETASEGAGRGTPSGPPEWSVGHEGETYGTSPQEAENSLHRRSWWRRFFGFE
jgi:hypothetical protein